jgi:hypothetical protein
MCDTSLALWMAFALSACAWAAGDDPVVIDMGGLRQVTAFLTVSENQYRIKVRLLPVKCFDEVTNAEVNQDKARRAALQALARSLSKKPAVEFTVSGARVESRGMEGKFYTLTLSVPRKGVTVLAVSAEPSSTPASETKEDRQRILLDSTFTRSRRDHENTLRQLATGIVAAVRNAERHAPDHDKPEEGPAYKRGLQDIAALGQKNLDALAETIREDLLLSDVDGFGDEPSERKTLLRSVAREKEKARSLVNEAIKRYKTKTAEKDR